jgi:hypothetical protein
MGWTDAILEGRTQEAAFSLKSQCCDLKIADGSMRVWLCRVGGGISIEKLVNDRWRRVEGGCLT